VAGSSISKTLRPYESREVKIKRALFAKPLGYLLVKLGRMNKNKELSLNFLNYKRLKVHATAEEIRGKIGAVTFNGLFKFAFVRNPWDWQVSLYHYMLQNPNHHQHHQIKKLPNFNAYIHWRIKQPPKLQKDFITDRDGNIIIDYIGKLETIHQDIDYLADRLNIRINLPHINKSQRKSFEDYYTSETFNLVYEYFYDDIQLFGYSQ
jgi:hypothetical protein